MSKKMPKGLRKPQTRKRAPVNVRRQGPPLQGSPLSPSSRKPISPFVARGKNVNFVQGNQSRQINNTMQTMARDVMTLRKENAALKAQLAKVQKKP
jgi:hypothetical protein